MGRYKAQVAWVDFDKRGNQGTQRKPSSQVEFAEQMGTGVFRLSSYLSQLVLTVIVD